MTRMAGAAVVFIGAAVVGAVVVGTPAEQALAVPRSAAEIVEVSPDGVAYTRSYSELFDGHLLVPRETVHDTFTVRNNGDTAGYLRVVLTAVAIPDHDVLDALSVAAGTAEHPGTPVSASAAEPCATLLEGQSIPSGAAVTVASTLTLGDLTATRGQSVPISFSLEVLLSERPDQDASGCPIAESAPPPDSGSAPGADEGLAATGLAGVGRVGAIGVAMIVAGAAFAGWWHRRRREPRKDDDR